MRIHKEDFEVLARTVPGFKKEDYKEIGGVMVKRVGLGDRVADFLKRLGVQQDVKCKCRTRQSALNRLDQRVRVFLKSLFDKLRRGQ